MLRHAYPEREAHKEQHRELIDSVRALQQQVMEAGGRLNEEDLEFLEHWLVQHILTEDMKLDAYLSERMP